MDYGLLNTNFATVNGKKPRNSDRILPAEALNFRGLLDAATNVPVVGDALSGGLALYDAAKGDYGSAAMNALGVLPFLSAGMVKKAKQTVTIPAHDDFFTAVGKEPRNVMADVDKLHRKHLDRFDSPDAVEDHLKYVFGAAPDHFMGATDPRFMLIARKADQLPVETGEAFRTAVADMSGARNGNYWVRSAFPMSAEQMDVKLARGRVAVPDSGVPILDGLHSPGAKQARALASSSPEETIAPLGLLAQHTKKKP